MKDEGNFLFMFGPTSPIATTQTAKAAAQHKQKVLLTKCSPLERKHANKSEELSARV